ncbi:hypothetical protein E3N88_08161 [Mikania micrantha]|uniref:Cytochrome P450 n=1 Tax=Mikania micrantha TaxID=192012 RepID=A0A5N6PHP8_9ASTR|nr:hypothetical protein E3N88_08161 [Mikania micrantha]
MKSDSKDTIYYTMINYWSWWWEVDNERDELARTILTISVPLLVLLWFMWTTSITQKRTNLPPGPYGLPVVGYLPFLGHNLHERFTEMAHKYGPIFSLRLGSKFHVVVNSMDLAKVVARELDQTFANRSPPITALTITYGALDVVWSNNNTHWRNSRKLLVSQVLSNVNLDSCQDFRTKEVRKTVSNVFAKMGTPVDINEIAFDTELNVVTRMLWGCSDYDDYFHGFREVEFKIIELEGRKKEMQKQKEHLDRIIDMIIEERIERSSRKMEGEVDEDLILKKDFLQIMLELKDASPSFDIVQIKALLFDILSAATDTASTMVEWVMAEILHNPNVKKKIQEELTEVIVPKGSIVYINIWAIHHDPNNWPHPLEFRHDRFLNGKWDYNGNNFKFLPFGAGRRICPGIALGEKMLVYILASLLHSFEWILPADEEFEISDEFGFVTKKRKPLVAIPFQRLSDATIYK